MLLFQVSVSREMPKSESKLFNSLTTLIHPITSLSAYDTFGKYDFLKTVDWQKVKGFFEPKSAAFLEAMKTVVEKKQNYVSMEDWALLSSRYQAMRDDPFKSPKIRFNSTEDFLRFNSEVGKSLSEAGRVALGAEWLKPMWEYYDFGKAGEPFLKSGAAFFPPMDGREVIGNYFSGKKTGICGDINSGAAKLIFNSLGLEHAAVNIFTSEGGHIVSFLKGKEGYYGVDYNAKILGTSYATALDRFLSMERFTPFSTGISRGLAFDKGATEKMLYSLIGLAGDDISKGVTGKAAMDASGIFGAEGNVGFSRLSVGGFMLGSMPAVTNLVGAKLSYAAKKGEGSIFAPNLFFAAMLADTWADSFPLMIAQIKPYLFASAAGKGILRAAPLNFELASDAKSLSGQVTTSMGYEYLLKDGAGKGKVGKISGKIDLRYVNDENDYYNVKKIGITPRASMGYQSGKTGLEIAYKPESIASKLDISGHSAIADWNAAALFFSFDLQLSDSGKSLPSGTAGLVLYLK